MIEKFIQWYRLTHWNYRGESIIHEDGRFVDGITQAMLIAYRAGYNKRKREEKDCIVRLKQ